MRAEINGRLSWNAGTFHSMLCGPMYTAFPSGTMAGPSVLHPAHSPGFSGPCPPPTPPSSSCPALAARKLHELHFVFLFAVMSSQHLDSSQGKASTQSMAAE